MRKLSTAYLLTFSQRGAEVAESISAYLEKNGIIARKYIAARHKKLVDADDFQAFDSVRKITEQIFADADAIIFVCSVGIAVRAVSAHIKSKLTDPAVIVCDECGKFAVSLLSGHAGGANRLTEKIAEAIGATPVITTASDVHENIENNKNLVLGIGCRKNLSAEDIERAVTILLWDRKIPLSRVVAAASIDIKSNDLGLKGFARAHGIPLNFYSADKLSALPAEKWGFSQSERVLRHTGVGNVCERAAVLCGEKMGIGSLIIKKSLLNGVACAVFELVLNGDA